MCTFHTLLLCGPPTLLRGRHHAHSHYTSEETEAHRGGLIYSPKASVLSTDLRTLDPQSIATPTSNSKIKKDTKATPLKFPDHL